MTTATGPQLDLEIPPATLGYTVQYIDHASIFPDPTQPRKEPDPELRDSIRAQGILQPITVRPNPDRLDGTFMIIYGERRWRGAEGILPQVPVIIREDLDARPERLTAQLVENVSKPLSPLEEARAYAELVPLHGSVAALARELGRPITSVAERLHLLEIGPWVALVESGEVTMSHAVKALLPYRGCSDAVHQAAIDELRKFGGHDRIEPPAHVDEFIEDVDRAYEPMLYPLTKSKTTWHKQPEFDVRKHNDECDCGRITLQRHKSEQKRDWCGNPEWWKPLAAAAKKEERKKAKAKGAKSSKSPATPKVFHMPAEASEYKKKDFNDSGPKGLVYLTKPYDPKWDAVDFDPTTLKIDATKLVLVHDYWSGGRPRVATKDAAAVKAARDAWSTRWRDRHTGVVGALKKSIDAKAAGYKVTGAGVGELLARLEVEPGDLVDVALACGVKVPDTLDPLVPGNDLRAGAEKWLGGLSDNDASKVATGLAMLLGTRTKAPNAKVREEIVQAQQDIVRKAVPWTKAPKGGAKGKPAKGKKAASKADVDEDIIDDEE